MDMTCLIFFLASHLLDLEVGEVLPLARPIGVIRVNGVIRITGVIRFLGLLGS